MINGENLKGIEYLMGELKTYDMDYYAIHFHEDCDCYTLSRCSGGSDFIKGGGVYKSSSMPRVNGKEVLNNQYVLIQDFGDKAYLMDKSNCLIEVTSDEFKSLISKNEVAFLSYRDYKVPKPQNKDKQAEMINAMESAITSVHDAILSKLHNADNQISSNSWSYMIQEYNPIVEAVATYIERFRTRGYNDTDIYEAFSTLFKRVCAKGEAWWATVKPSKDDEDSDDICNVSLHYVERVDGFAIAFDSIRQLIVFAKPGVIHFNLKPYWFDRNSIKERLFIASNLSYDIESVLSVRLLFLPDTVVNFSLAEIAKVDNYNINRELLFIKIFGSSSIRRASLYLDLHKPLDGKPWVSPYICNGFDLENVLITPFNNLCNFSFLLNVRDNQYVDVINK